MERKKNYTPLSAMFCDVQIVGFASLDKVQKNFDWMKSQQKMIALFPNLRTIIVNKYVMKMP